MKKKLIFEGVATALVTPMHKEKIDYTSVSRIINHQIESGVSAIVVGGTTGEVATLTEEEKDELYTYAREKIAGKAKLVLGVGTNDTRAVERRVKSAEKIGCDGLLVVTPYYNKGTFRGVTEHYKRIAGSTDLPIILYNVPSRTGVNLTISQLEELAKIENIVAIKEASDSLDRLTELSFFGDELYLYSGNDSQIYLTLALGGRGVISVVSNLYPKEISNMCSLYFEGKGQESFFIQRRLFGLIKVLFQETNPTPIKYAMSLSGLCSSEVRLPLFEPENSTRDAIKREIEKLAQV